MINFGVVISAILVAPMNMGCNCTMHEFFFFKNDKVSSRYIFLSILAPYAQFLQI